VIDALFWMQKHLNIERINDVLDSRVLEVIANQKPYVLITGHRRESFGEGFSSICKAIKRLSQQYPDYYFVYPVHLNPNVREIVYKELGDHHNIVLCDPIDYEPFIYLLEQCKLVLTDSGGIQEEAPSLGKPVLVMREKTERPEGVEAGTAKLVGTHVETIVSEVSSLLDDSSAYLAMANAVNPYGDGLASERTLKAISLSFSPKPVKEQVF